VAPAAAAIAGLVCAAELARRHGDTARARRYLHEADARQRHVAVPRRDAAVLELVRLGVLPARDPRVRAALAHARLTPAARGEYAVAVGLPARRWLAASAPADGDLDAVRLARFVRLARDVRARRLLGRPAVVARRYARARP